jgi:HAD superfamily hydrolase (TIGR01484 family)
MKENRFEYVPHSEKADQSGLLRKKEGKIERKNPLSAYIGSEHLNIIREQEREGRLPAALFTDIDNTFYRKDRNWSSKVLFRDLRQENYPVVAVTGNSFSEIEKRMQSGELPYFPIIAGAVGTEIHVLHEKDGKKMYKKDEAYEQVLLAKGYNRLELAKTGQRMIEDLGGKNPEHRPPHLEWGLVFQKPDKEREFMERKVNAETPFKLSFHAFAASGASLEALKNEVSKRFPGQCVVLCEEVNYNSQMQEDDINKKYNIDILPTTKAGVIDYIGNTTGVAFKVVAGDSGNDAEMLMGSNGDVSIIVGGATAELLGVVDKNIFGNKINKDIKKIRDSTGKEKLYYREIGTGRGPESISKVFKMLNAIQKIL